jgi:hypothetical protein
MEIPASEDGEERVTRELECDDVLLLLGKADEVGKWHAYIMNFIRSEQ